jgi:hypothetical protein
MEAETDFEYEGHLFKLPMYSYLLLPQKQQGFLRRSDTSDVMLPLWTARSTRTARALGNW